MMRGLELKLPPPLVALLVGAAMWAVARVSYRFELFTIHRQAVAGALFVLGVLCALSAVLAFRRWKTTINPTKPEASTSLVRTGPFRFSRNPMYLSLLLVLLGWAVLLAAPWALIGPLVFYFYIQRFQILPEERALTLKFGAEFEKYRRAVRRWL